MDTLLCVNICIGTYIQVTFDYILCVPANSESGYCRYLLLGLVFPPQLMTIFVQNAFYNEEAFPNLLKVKINQGC